MESCHNMPSGYQENDRILQNAATDQVLHSLLKDVSLNFFNKNEKYHLTTLKTEMDWSN